MTRKEMKRAIENNLKTNGISNAEIRVQRNPYGDGLQIIVIAADFSNLSHQERRSRVFGDGDVINVEWFELLTPEEREWAGPLPLDIETGELPLWPEALARGKLSSDKRQSAHFPSDIDDDLPLPIVATFYSLRGGVGRSTALAYTGSLLAQSGRKIILIDMDLEAPGLAALFDKEQEIEKEQGLVHILSAYDSDDKPSLVDHLIRLSEASDLYCLPAGKPDAEYARLLRNLDPTSWYREENNPLHLLIDDLSETLPFSPDVILIDSRTGINNLSGPLLFDISDLAVIMFFPHPQAKTGTEALVRALIASKTRRKMSGGALTPEPRFLVSPIPSVKAPGVAKRYQHRAVEWISDWLEPLTRDGGEHTDLNEIDITHFVYYRDDLATSDKILPDTDIGKSYQPVAEWIELLIPSSEEVAARTPSTIPKNQILGELSFSAGTAEYQEDFAKTFVETPLFSKALSPDIPLVLGRKGTGKTAVFRWLLERTDEKSVVVTAPSQLKGSRSWILGPDGFKQIEKELINELKIDWRQFWVAYIALSCHLSSIGADAIDDQLDEIISTQINDELDLLKTMKSLFALPNSSLLIKKWLGMLDENVSSNTLVLFDGLDTGFGNEEADRTRRSSAVSGLFAFVIDQADQLKNLRLKIVLRYDIWKRTDFPNKSHMFGRSVILEWSDLIEFLKVPIKQALRSNTFQSSIKTLPGGSIVESIEIKMWPDDLVLKAWNYLVGERMKGGRTTFSRNWVWSRLADGNGEHSPRYLLQLLHEAISWEKRENKKNIYERSIIRPRALSSVLPEVSEQALGALREEFKELNPLLKNLKSVGRTPVTPENIKENRELVDLAREVGLLEVYEGTDENVDRYKVPDLYRWALKMTRKGQA